MKATIYYIIALLLMTSCARKVTDKLFSTEQENFTTNSADSTFLLKLDSISKFYLSSVEYEFSTIVYSSPDSAGNQYPVSKTTGRILKKDSTSLTSVSADQSSAKKNTITTGVRKKDEFRTKESETKPYVPPWVYAISAFIGLACIAFIVVWIKKYGFY